MFQGRNKIWIKYNIFLKLSRLKQYSLRKRCTTPRKLDVIEQAGSRVSKKSCYCHYVTVLEEYHFGFNKLS